ncbi:MAG: exosome complex exonuclease Rrp41 [Nanoarchaeota archaeon]|nr:exosome complex exonuclease Rrp41 [Nanoarchaeota archaeon]MBU1135548.1 exosome complex exonuclease Rrp41 [Nanoarchaeota archaeon]MBU2520387.1 exosome complex exonuclease Rrp41 [Nanoarchaeota archaeon]
MVKREDGRKPDEMRPIEIKAGVIKNADGSAMVKFGKTIAIAAVYGPRAMHPRRMQEPDRTVLRCRYSMVPFSTTDRCRPGPSRRSTEISKVTREALEPALFLDEIPKTVIDVFIDVIAADAGTRTTGINAASVALADAGIPMRDLVASVAAGKIGKEVMVDLAGKEEEETSCDVPIAYMPRSKQVTLLQMDGDIPVKDFNDVLKMATKSCEQIYKKQKEALGERWIK